MFTEQGPTRAAPNRPPLPSLLSPPLPSPRALAQNAPHELVATPVHLFRCFYPESSAASKLNSGPPRRGGSERWQPGAWVVGRARDAPCRDTPRRCCSAVLYTSPPTTAGMMSHGPDDGTLGAQERTGSATPPFFAGPLRSCPASAPTGGASAPRRVWLILPACAGKPPLKEPAIAKMALQPLLRTRSADDGAETKALVRRISLTPTSSAVDPGSAPKITDSGPTRCPSCLRALCRPRPTPPMPRNRARSSSVSHDLGLTRGC